MLLTYLLIYLRNLKQFVSLSFLADRTNGRAIATLLRLSSVVCL